MRASLAATADATLTLPTYAASVLTVAVLGPVELLRDGVPLEVPSGRTTEVLVRLALDAGRPVRVDRLIEDLWEGATRNTLQVKVSKLRRALNDPNLVGGGPAGYTLRVDPSAVDALEVLRLAELPHPDGTGLSLFKTDEILPDAGDWAEPWRTRLADARLRLTEGHLAARLGQGAAGELIGELESLVTAYPLREGLWQLLITALYRDGRQGEALATYRKARERLADELGVDPGPELRALERRILRQDEQLAPRTGNLPAVTGRLIGRDRDLAAVRREIGERKLVTLVGPAGVGKTRLAIEAARERGGWLVRLESAGSIWQAIGEAFGMADASDAMVLDRLRGPRVLLLLDNCEHLIDRLIPVVERIMTAAPTAMLLTTSQVPLGLEEELAYGVEPLPPHDAVALFVERARKHRPIGPGDDVTAVCRALDGLPLAIELAAARAKALPVPEIARRLDDRFTLLNDPNSRRPARRRTLSAAIGWSYDLLFPDDQRGLWALSTFAGGAPLDAAESVLAALGVPRAAALDALDRLVDRSLAKAEITEKTVFFLLDSVRAYGRDQRDRAGAEQVARKAHATWHAEAADRAAQGVRGPGQATHLAFARTARADIDAAIAWASEHDPLMALRMVNGFGWAWIFLGAGSDAAARSRRVLEAAGRGAPPVERMDALLFAGWFEASGGDLDRAFADVRAARAIAPLPRTLLIRAFLHSQQGRPTEALAALAGFRESNARLPNPGRELDAPPGEAGLGRELGAPPGEAGPGGELDAPPGKSGPGRELGAQPREPGPGWELGPGWESAAASLLEAWADIALGDTAGARAACDAALRGLPEDGDRWARSHAEALLGGLAQAEHRYADAVAHLTRAADAAHRLGFTAAEALHLANLGRARQQAGEPDEALAALDRSAAAAGSAGDLRGVALARTRRARVRYALGRTAEARDDLRKARAWYESAGGGDGDLLSAQLTAAIDDDRPALERVLAAARATGDPEVEVLALDALARTEEADRAFEHARHLMAPGDRPQN
jgi:predicted ATPase/DNA-binding SARP family transcriptional activator